MEPNCRSKRMLAIKRCKHFELGGDKKRKVRLRAGDGWCGGRCGPGHSGGLGGSTEAVCQAEGLAATSLVACRPLEEGLRKSIVRRGRG